MQFFLFLLASFLLFLLYLELPPRRKPLPILAWLFFLALYSGQVLLLALASASGLGYVLWLLEARRPQSKESEAKELYQLYSFLNTMLGAGVSLHEALQELHVVLKAPDKKRALQNFGMYLGLQYGDHFEEKALAHLPRGRLKEEVRKLLHTHRAGQGDQVLFLREEAYYKSQLKFDKGRVIHQYKMRMVFVAGGMVLFLLFTTLWPMLQSLSSISVQLLQ